MPECEKIWGGAVVICGHNLPYPPPVEKGLTDLPNIDRPVAPLAPRSRHYWDKYHLKLE